ncbi:adenylate cyclase [Acrasis kona]|uniref:adenylate cyclase n=1 Tax=Acrasis kona TaxID=1008807 RepID=A0AAW2YYM8_9EUKA
MERYYRASYLALRKLEIEKKQSRMELGRSFKILENIIPSKSVMQLREYVTTLKDTNFIPFQDRFYSFTHYESVSVLVSDVVSFTSWSSVNSSATVIFMLNTLFSAFDKICIDLNIEKIKTIGDGYFCVSGMNDELAERDSYSLRIVQMAIKMITSVINASEQYKWNIKIRIGISTGPVHLSIIGHTKITFDCCGAAVEVAKVMESNSIPNKIQVCDVTRLALESRFKFIPHMEYQVQGTRYVRGNILEQEQQETNSKPEENLLAITPIVKIDDASVNSNSNDVKFNVLLLVFLKNIQLNYYMFKFSYPGVIPLFRGITVFQLFIYLTNIFPLLPFVLKIILSAIQVMIACFTGVNFTFAPYLQVYSISIFFLQIVTSYFTTKSLLQIFRLSTLSTFRLNEIKNDQVINEKLIHNLLPANIIKKIYDESGFLYDEISTGCVCFIHVSGYDELYLYNSDIAMDFLKNVYLRFDDDCDVYKCHKIKSMWNTYLIVAGLNKEEDYCDRIAKFCLNARQNFNNLLLNCINDKIDKEAHDILLKVNLMCGIHSGSFVAGVVGVGKFLYDVFGDTINTASRMCSSAEHDSIQLSEVSYQLLKDNFETKYRGELLIKGKGMMNTYLLSGYKEQDKATELDFSETLKVD